MQENRGSGQKSEKLKLLHGLVGPTYGQPMCIIQSLSQKALIQRA